MKKKPLTQTRTEQWCLHPPREKLGIRLFIIMTTDSKGFKNAFPPVVSFEMELEAREALITLVYCSYRSQPQQATSVSSVWRSRSLFIKHIPEVSGKSTDGGEQIDPLTFTQFLGWTLALHSSCKDLVSYQTGNKLERNCVFGGSSQGSLLLVHPREHERPASFKSSLDFSSVVSKLRGDVIKMHV